MHSLLPVLISVLVTTPAAEAARRGKKNKAQQGMLMPDLSRVLGDAWDVPPELSERAQPGAVLEVSAAGYRRVMEGCIAAAPKESAVTNVSMQNSLSGGIGWSTGGVGVGASATDTLKVSFVGPVVLGYDLIDFVPSTDCRDKLAAFTARGGDLSRVVVVQESLMARVNGCEQQDLGVDVKVAGRGVEMGTTSACQMFSDAPVAVGVKSVAIARIPELASLVGVRPDAPAARPAPAPAPTGPPPPISSVDLPTTSAHALQASVESYLQLRIDGISSDLSSREFDRRLVALIKTMESGLADIEADSDTLAAGPAPTNAEAVVLLGIAREWLGEALVNSPIPAYLTPDQVALYQAGLRDKQAGAGAGSVRDYARALALAEQSGTQTAATAWACTRLRQLDPASSCVVRGNLTKTRSLRDTVEAATTRLRTSDKDLAGCRAYSKDDRSAVAMVLDQAGMILDADEASMMADILAYLEDTQAMLDGYAAKCR
jgi:hypothetical protein